MKFNFLLTIVCCFPIFLFPNQNISLHIPGLDGINAKLSIYQGLGKKVVSAVRIDESGFAQLSYPDGFKGAGIIEIDFFGETLIILGEENIKVSFVASNEQNALKIESKENKLLDEFLEFYQLNENKLSGLKWLKPLYTEDRRRLRLIDREINRLKKQIKDKIREIPEDYFISYYIPLRIFIEQMPASINQYWERVPGHIETFHTIDFSDERLFNSGLIGSLLSNYVMLCESAGSGSPDLDSVYVLLYAATDHILNTIEGDDELTNLYSKQLFQLFESRSLFRASEYLSLNVLNSACELEAGLERRLEQYRKMQTGNPAPEIFFINPVNGKNKLSDIESEYKLIVFWASWCPHCMEDIPQLNKMYDQLQKHNIEVIAVSLDYDEQHYKNAIQDLNWINYCDFKGWESQAAIDYHVFATPTYYLLDKNNTIYWKINSISHLSSVIQHLFF